jgi:uncharacterized protein YkwD
MPRLRTLVPSMALACVLLVPAPPAQGASAKTQMVWKVSQFRKMNGIGGVRQSRSLNRSARRYARRMLRRGYFGHAGRIHTSPRFRHRGEIIAMHPGGRARVARTLRMWANSPGHRAVMLDRSFDWVGAGKVTGRWHGRRYSFWVVHFGSR